MFFLQLETEATRILFCVYSSLSKGKVPIAFHWWLLCFMRCLYSGEAPYSSSETVTDPVKSHRWWWGEGAEVSVEEINSSLTWLMMKRVVNRAARQYGILVLLSLKKRNGKQHKKLQINICKPNFCSPFFKEISSWKDSNAVIDTSH